MFKGKLLHSTIIPSGILMWSKSIVVFQTFEISTDTAQHSLELHEYLRSKILHDFLLNKSSIISLNHQIQRWKTNAGRHFSSSNFKGILTVCAIIFQTFFYISKKEKIGIRRQLSSIFIHIFSFGQFTNGFQMILMKNSTQTSMEKWKKNGNIFSKDFKCASWQEVPVKKPTTDHGKVKKFSTAWKKAMKSKTCNRM